MYCSSRTESRWVFANDSIHLSSTPAKNLGSGLWFSRLTGNLTRGNTIYLHQFSSHRDGLSSSSLSLSLSLCLSLSLLPSVHICHHLGRFFTQHPVSTESRWMLVFIGRQTLVCLCVRVCIPKMPPIFDCKYLQKQIENVWLTILTPFFLLISYLDIVFVRISRSNGNVLTLDF